MLKKCFCYYFVFLLSACAVGPDYVSPKLNLPEKWLADSFEAAEVANLRWWDQFGDPELGKLIQVALEQNKDLALASARIDRFYALYGISRSDLFPRINAQGDYQRFERSESVFSEFGGITDNNFSAGLELAWELDFWGRIRRANESARASLLSQEATRRAVILTLVASVARAYTELRQFDRQLEISRKTLKTRMASYDLAKTRFDGGLVSDLDVAQAEGEVAATEATIPELEARIAARERQLNVLLGEYPRPIVRGKAVHDLALAASVPSGIPSDVLLNRPDVIAAEYSLVAANAEIGVAIGEFFPKFSITGLFGYQSAEFDDLFDGPARNWNWGPGISLPIFNAGRLLYNLDATKAAEREALANYERTILVAFQEVEDALVGFRKVGEQRIAREKQVKVLGRYNFLAQSRYDEGQTSYLEVLDAQRFLFSAELDLAQSEGQRVSSLIELYRSMGGGWVAEAENLSPNVQAPKSGGEKNVPLLVVGP